MDKRKVDVLIIGAGIAGLTSAIYLRRSAVSFLLLDKGMPGGKLNNVHKIENYPGTGTVSGPELSMRLLKQVSELGIVIEYASVMDIEREEDHFLVHSDVFDIEATSIIVASGSENKKLGIPGEKEYFGRGVSYCATCDGNFYRNKPVALIGSNDRAIEEAVYLSSIVSRLYVFSKKGSDIPALANLDNVMVIKDDVVSIEGGELVESVKSSSGESYPVNGVFQLSGEVSASAFLSRLGVKTEKGFVIVNGDCSSSVEGIYAAGDIVHKSLRQAINAASEGAISAVSSIAYVSKRKRK